MASFYGWGSTASRLVPVDEAVYFLPLYGLITLISKENGKCIDSTSKKCTGCVLC